MDIEIVFRIFEPFCLTPLSVKYDISEEPCKILHFAKTFCIERSRDSNLKANLKIRFTF